MGAERETILAMKRCFAVRIARDFTAFLKFDVGLQRNPRPWEDDTARGRGFSEIPRAPRDEGSGVRSRRSGGKRQPRNAERRAAKGQSAPRRSQPGRWIGARYIVSEEHGFVYLATPKVASTSILNALLPYFDFDLDIAALENLKRGIPIKGIHETFNRSPYRIDKTAFLAGMDGHYDRYLKFAFVRNPWDRLVSCYMSKIVLRGPGMPMGKYGDATLRRTMTFQEFAEAVCLIPEEEANPHFRSQHTFLCYDEPGKGVIADLVGRFENLEEDFDLVTRTIGIRAHLSHAVSTDSVRNSRSYRDFYDQRLARIVGERYREDTAIFGYSF